jgi:hypothetical protein
MFSEKLTWGAPPAGFKKLTDGNGNRLIVRREREREIDFSVCQNDSGKTTESQYQGRGAVRIFSLSDGETALVRQYRHGGIFHAATGSWFFTWPPRPFRELTITEELRRRGLRTVEVYAACVRVGPWPFYRGWLVTRELRGAVDLWSALRGGFVEQVGLQRTLRAVADTIRSMHREGVYHRDLNLKNILVRQEADRVASYLIDFDRAALFIGKLPAELVRRNLDRLLRSACKLDPERRYFSVSAWDEFFDFYHGSSRA